MRKRYSYTQGNALRFVPIFDTLLEQIKESHPIIGLTLPLTKIHNTGMGIETFRHRLVDGLKFISELYHEIPTGVLKFEQTQYILLKSMLRVKSIDSDTILLIGVKQCASFFGAIKSSIEKHDITGAKVSAFKNSIIEFLADKDKPAAHFKNNKLDELSEADKLWLTEELEGRLKLTIVWSDNDTVLTIVK